MKPLANYTRFLNAVANAEQTLETFESNPRVEGDEEVEYAKKLFEESGLNDFQF